MAERDRHKTPKKKKEKYYEAGMFIFLRRVFLPLRNEDLFNILQIITIVIPAEAGIQLF